MISMKKEMIGVKTSMKPAMIFIRQEIGAKMTSMRQEMIGMSNVENRFKLSVHIGNC